MLSAVQEVNRLRDLGRIQKCLVALSDNLSDPNYTLELFRNDLVGYLKEAQYNNRIPKNINIEESISFRMDNTNGVVFVNFSPELEDYITDNGNYVVDELKESHNTDGVNI